MTDLARRFVRWWGTPAAVDLATCLVYTAFAFWLTHGLWPNPATRALAENVNDQALIEWFLSHGVLLWTGDGSLVTDRLNVPDGVNLMSNASHILHGLLMAPVTVLLGVPVSFALLTALNLAATAAGWYLLLARGLRLHRTGALIGGAFAGFAPGMISQSNSHLHMTAQWLVPPIVWCVIKLTRATTTRSVVWTALSLAALVCAQLFLGEEVLYLTALTLTIFTIAYAIRRPRWARRVAPRFLAGMGLAALVAAIALAYPLWVQVRGPQHIPNAPFAPHYYFADVASFIVFSPLSLAGSAEAGKLAANATEYNTYLGLPLVALVIALAIWLRASAAAAAAVATSVVMAMLSLGPHITVNGRQIGLPGPYSLIADVPLINAALPTRYALALIPLFGFLLARALDTALQSSGFVRVAVPLAVTGALLPLMPMPLATTERDPVPTFITSGAWRQCAPEGGVIVPVPLPSVAQPDAMRWPAAAHIAFGIPEGFFIGPYGKNGTASLGAPASPTSRLFTEVAKTGQVPRLGETEVALARADLARWKADCVALTKGPNQEALRATVEKLLGPGTLIEDTWTWRISR